MNQHPNETQALLDAAKAGNEVCCEWFGKVTASDDCDALLGTKIKNTDYAHLGYEDAFTLADQASEDAILPILRQCRPDIPVVSEESCPDCAAWPDGTQRWLVDPIDGTSRFKQGQPDYSITLALQTKRDGVWTTDVGVISVPMEDRLYIADATGAKLIHGSTTTPLHYHTPAESAFSGTRADALDQRKVEVVIYSRDNKALMGSRERFNEAVAKSGGKPQSTFSTAYALVNMLQPNGADACIMAGNAMDFAWDTDAALHIAEKAGLHVRRTQLDGEPVVIVGKSKSIVAALEFQLRDEYKAGLAGRQT